MNSMLNRKMPPQRAAWGFVALSSILSFLFALKPSGLLLTVLAITFAAVGLLSIPRMTYPRVLLLALAAGLLPAILGGLLTRSIASAIAAFAFAPATALLVLTIRRRQSRSAGILWTTALLALFYLAALLAWLYQRAGSLSVAAFQQLYSDVKAIFIEYCTPILEQNASLFTDMEDLLPTLYDTFLGILPGLYLCVLWVLAWLSTVFLRWIFRGYVYGAERFSVWPVTASRPVAWIYLAAVLISVLPLSGKLAIIPIVASNFYLILLPVFTIVGCRVLKEQMMRAPGCGCFPIVLFGFLFMMLTGALLLLSFIGAFRTVAPQRIRPQTPPSDTQDPDQGGNPQ